MEETRIKVLGRTKKEIGNQLELLIKQALDRLGFGDFAVHAYRTGTEIDLRAVHKVTESPIMCECKAQSAPIGTKDIKNFHSEIEKQRKRDERIFGLFISISDFTGTAKAWYEELINSDPSVAKYFGLRGPQDLIKMLVDTKAVIAPESIQRIVQQQLPTYKQGDCWLTYSIYGLTWVVLLLLDGVPRFHVLLGPQGEPVPTWTSQEIGKLSRKDLRKTRLLGLEIRRKVLVTLLALDNQTIDEISNTIQEPRDDIALALNKLKSERKICVNSQVNNSFRLERDLIQYVNIAQEFLETSDATTFVHSPYSQEMLRSEAVLTYIDQRYQLGMSIEQKDLLGKIVSISPSAAQRALFGETETYLRTHQQIMDIKDQTRRAQWELAHATSLLRDLHFLLISDLQAHNTSNHLAHLGIKRYRLKTRLDMTGSIGRYLSMDAISLVAIETAGNTIEAGSLVSHSNPAEYHYWTGCFYLECGELGSAHEEFDQALRSSLALSNQNELQVAVRTNKGVAYMREEKWADALICFDDALNLGGTPFSQVIDNKALCLEKIGRHSDAIELLVTAEQNSPELFNNDYHNQVKHTICNANS